MATDLTQLAINAIRILAIDAVQQADSGHPGAPMGLAAVAYTIWTRHLRHAPQQRVVIGRPEQLQRRPRLGQAEQQQRSVGDVAAVQQALQPVHEARGHERAADGVAPAEVPSEHRGKAAQRAIHPCRAGRRRGTASLRLALFVLDWNHADLRQRPVAAPCATPRGA